MEESISHPIHTHSHLPPPPKPHQSFPQTCSSQLITHSNCIYGGTGKCGHRVMPWQNRWKNTFPASTEKVRQVDRQSQCREGGLLLWAECYEPGTQPSWGWSAEGEGERILPRADCVLKDEWKLFRKSEGHSWQSHLHNLKIWAMEWKCEIWKREPGQS